MKISVNDEKLYELNETQKRVIKNDIHKDEFEQDMKRRLHWVLNHKYERCFERLKKEWQPKLRDRGIKMLPTGNDAFAELVFSQPDYKCRATREAANN